MKNTPATKIRIRNLEAAIWRNETDQGVRFNVTFTRFYRDGEQWKSSTSFGRDDLLLLAKIADRAHDRIFELVQEASSDKGE